MDLRIKESLKIFFYLLFFFFFFFFFFFDTVALGNGLEFSVVEPLSTQTHLLGHAVGNCRYFYVSAMSILW